MQLFNQIKIQTLLEISLKFYRLEMPWLYVLVYLFQLVKYQSLSLPSGHSLFQFILLKKLTLTISYSNIYHEAEWQTSTFFSVTLEYH